LAEKKGLGDFIVLMPDERGGWSDVPPSGAWSMLEFAAYVEYKKMSDVVELSSDELLQDYNRD
jgi:hypothetical protein